MEDSEAVAFNSGNKVSEEQALREFENFADAMDIDIDVSKMDEDDLAGFEKQRRRIVKACVQGHLIYNENNEPVYTPHRKASKYKEPITFHERTGNSLIAMDGKKKGHDVGKMYAVLGDMCGQPPAVFAGLAGTDIKVCEAIFALLMD